jgi:hypothetical protein
MGRPTETSEAVKSAVVQNGVSIAQFTGSGMRRKAQTRNLDIGRRMQPTAGFTGSR